MKMPRRAVDCRRIAGRLPRRVLVRWSAVLLCIGPVAAGCGLARSTPHAAADEVDDALAPSRLAELVRGGETDADVLAAAVDKIAPDQVTESWLAPIGKALCSGEADVRRAAALSLKLLGARAKPAQPSLAEALGDDDSQVRITAARTLIALEAAPNPAVISLAVKLHDDDPQVRFQAANMLGKFEHRAAVAVPALVRLAQDADSHVSVRWEALSALRDIGEAGCPALAEIARSTTQGTQYKALDALAQLGTEAAAATDTLVELLQADDFRVRSRAAFALGAIGPAARQALPALQRAARDRNPQVRQNARQAIAKIMAGD